MPWNDLFYIPVDPDAGPGTEPGKTIIMEKEIKTFHNEGKIKAKRIHAYQVSVQGASGRNASD